MIPVYIVEEHHEAFLVWNYAIHQQKIPACCNILLHVDEHSDMGTPRFNRSIHSLNGDFESLKAFTFSELNIAGFITPAIYKGIFNKVYWIRQKHRTQKQNRTRMYVRSYNQSGMRLMSGRMANLKSTIEDADRKEFDYYLRVADNLPKREDIILDIDLDYFSCSGNPNENQEIYVEITEDEYLKFKSNRYHRLNFCHPGRIEAVTKDDKFYYVLNNFREVYPAETLVDKSTIKTRVESFVTSLKKSIINPIIISICRSRHSGYTPPDQWEFIESSLLNALASGYDIHFEDMKEILDS